MDLTILSILFVLAFGCAFIDVAFGMGYGTLMSPILLIFGFSISVIVPVLLLSQMCVGMAACLFHQKFKNADFKSPNNKDTKAALIFTMLGGIAMTFAVLVVISVPSQILMFYVSLTIMSVGAILLLKKKFVFSKKKLYMIGGLSAFNKAISGGGFGPVVTSGQIMSGSEAKNAVAVTSFAETILSAFGFILYIFISGTFNLNLAFLVIFSGIIAAPLGAFIAKRLKNKDAKTLIGSIIIGLGVLTLIKCFF